MFCLSSVKTNMLLLDTHQNQKIEKMIKFPADVVEKVSFAGFVQL